MTLDLRSGRTNQRQVLVGLGIIAAIFLAQGLVSTLLTRSSDIRARHLSESSIASIEQIARVARDVDQERILLDEHVFEKEAVQMAAIETRLSDVATDLGQARDDYAALIELPNEANLWSQVQALLGRLNPEIAGVLEFSRQNMDVEARERMTGAVADFEELNRRLIDLIRLNRAGAADAMVQGASLQVQAERVRWAIRIGGVVVVVLFGWFGTRRVASYENAIAGYARELEERNRDLDAFAGRVAHDLKNAMGPIVMSPSMLRRSPAISPSILEIADRIDRASRRATAVVDALLAFSKATRQAEPHESAALRPIVKDVQEELAPLVAQLDVTVEVGEIPDVNLRCDPGLFRIVLANLCGNAVKYLEGRPERRARIAARIVNSSCQIEVEDTGPGIPKDAHEKIFEPFFRVQGTRAPGTGIGLATVRRILDARGGRITVESVEGHGSRFVVWIPLAKSSADAA